MGVAFILLAMVPVLIRVYLIGRKSAVECDECEEHGHAEHIRDERRALDGGAVPHPARVHERISCNGSKLAQQIL